MLLEGNNRRMVWSDGDVWVRAAGHLQPELPGLSREEGREHPGAPPGEPEGCDQSERSRSRGSRRGGRRPYAGATRGSRWGRRSPLRLQPRPGLQAEVSAGRGPSDGEEPAPAALRRRSPPSDRGKKDKKSGGRGNAAAAGQ